MTEARRKLLGAATAAARSLRGLACVAAVGLALACKTGPDLSADYGQTASENYELAIGEFADRDWEEAIAYADFVRIRFPFSRYAVEAELLVARAEFARDDFIIAQDSFRQFAKLHPTHEHVRNGWVSYMAALSAYKNAPTGFWPLPPYYQKDQSQLKDALGELAYFFDHHSGTIMEPYAVRLRDEVNRRLLEHEIYVARYYLKRNKPEAAIGRLESAHEVYPGIGLDAEVLFLLGLTYLRLDEIELARATFTELQVEHPDHSHGKQARLYLKYIFDTFGPADPNRPRPDRSPPRPVTPPLPKEKPNKSEKSESEKPEKSAPAKPATPTTATPEPQTTPVPGSEAAASPSAEASETSPSGQQQLPPPERESELELEPEPLPESLPPEG